MQIVRRSASGEVRPESGLGPLLVAIVVLMGVAALFVLSVGLTWVFVVKVGEALR